MTWITLDAERSILRRDLRIDPGGRIDQFLPPGRSRFRGEEEIDLAGRLGIPGLIQTHVHLCQSIMRCLAEGLSLESWLQKRIWPLEAAHDATTLRASARLGLLELLTGGTTAILDMGTTRHLETLVGACAESGIRAITGTALMDEGDGVPETLRRDVPEALDEIELLLGRLSQERPGRVGLCVAPRFIPSVSDSAWRALAAFAEKHDLLIHTHACETAAEVAKTREKTGRLPFAHLHAMGAASPRLRAAHGVWFSDAREREILRDSGGAIIHCPGSNAKLGSGTADVVSLWTDGVPVGIGCDGAACNNRLDAFEEMRRAAGAIAVLHGPETVDPARILDMATRVGAEILRLDHRIGSLEPGKAADLVVLDRGAGAGLWTGSADLHAAILFGAGRENVEEVWIEGKRLVQGGRLLDDSSDTILDEADTAARILIERMENGWRSPTN
jgi:cytosine/adenosine deaminase-related metal-dependent hydrolase